MVTMRITGGRYMDRSEQMIRYDCPTCGAFAGQYCKRLRDGGPWLVPYSKGRQLVPHWHVGRVAKTKSRPDLEP